MNILIPTDFCILSQYAYDLAQKFNINSKVNIHFVHVVDAPIEDESFESMDLIEFLKPSQRKMSEFIQGREAQGHVVSGKMTDVLIKLEDELNIDLVILGNESRTGWQELFSTNENTILSRSGRAPVLSLMCDRSALEIKKIALFHDIYDHTEMQIEVLKQLQDLLNLEVHLIYITQDLRNHSVRLQEIQANIPLKVSSVSSYPSKSVELGIGDFLMENSFDMVALGVYSQRNLKSYVLGSIVEQVHNHLHKPVFTFKLKAS